MNTASSPTRTYVAQCNKPHFDGYYFKKFTLPAEVENTSEYAAWFFLNRLNSIACLEACLTIEDYNNLEEQQVPTVARYAREAVAAAEAAKLKADHAVEATKAA